MIATQTFGRISAVKLFIVAATLFVLAFAFNASVAPAAGVMSAEGAAGIAMTADTVVPIGAVAPTTAEAAALATYFMGGINGYVLPGLTAEALVYYDTIGANARAPNPITWFVGAVTTTINSTVGTMTTMARGDPANLRGTGISVAIINTMQDFLFGTSGAIAMIVLGLGVAAFYRRRRPFFAVTKASTTGSHAFIRGGMPQAPHRYLTVSPATPIDDMRTSSRTTLAALPA